MIANCQNGIIGSNTDNIPNNHGTGTRVLGGQISNIRGRPIVIYGKNPVVENVTIGEFGYDVPDGQTPTGTRSGNEIAGIDLRGAIGGRVANNVIRTRTLTNDPRLGISLRQDADGVASRGCKIYGNSISGPARAIYTQPNSSYDPNP